MYSDMTDDERMEMLRGVLVRIRDTLEAGCDQVDVSPLERWALGNTPRQAVTDLAVEIMRFSKAPVPAPPVYVKVV